MLFVSGPQEKGLEQKTQTAGEKFLPVWEIDRKTYQPEKEKQKTKRGLYLTYTRYQNPSVISVQLKEAIRCRDCKRKRNGFRKLNNKRWQRTKSISGRKNAHSSKKKVGTKKERRKATS